MFMITSAIALLVYQPGWIMAILGALTLNLGMSEVGY